MGLLHRCGVCALALAAGAAALQFEPTAFRNLVFENGGQRLTVGAIKVPLWSAALAQSSESFSLENVSFTFGGATYDIRRIDLSGVTSTRAEIEALLSSSSSEPMANRLGKINAERISIPEMRVRQQVGKDTHTATYRNTVLTGIVGGRLASGTTEASSIEAPGSETTILINTGRTTISDMDMRAVANLYETKAENTSVPLNRIYGAFSIENIDLTESKDAVNIKVARMSGRDFLARPTRDSWSGMTAFLTELGEKDKLAPDDMNRIATLYEDLLGAFDMGLVEATSIEIKGSADKSKGQGGSGRISRIAYTGSTGSQPADFRWEGMDFSGKDNRVKIAAISLTGFSIAPTLEGLKGLQGKTPDQFDQATVRSLIPTLGTLRISGVDLDVLDDKAKGEKPERVRFTVRDYAVTADKPVNGIPTNIRVEQSNVAFKLPQNSDEALVKEIAALGYTTVDASSLVAATWNEAANEIALKEISVQAQDMGRVSLTGLIGNATRDLFSADNGTALAAAVGAKAKSVDLVIEDKGLLSRYLAKAAKEQKTSPESLRRIYAGAAPTVIASLIGDSEQAKTLGQAVSRFIAQPGKLTINAQPKNPSGFGAMDLMLASDPKDILPKLNITAKVE
jgi:hypothetical protein